MKEATKGRLLQCLVFLGIPIIFFFSFNWVITWDSSPTTSAFVGMSKALFVIAVVIPSGVITLFEFACAITGFVVTFIVVVGSIFVGFPIWLWEKLKRN